MPIPLNAGTEIARAYFSKYLGYTVDDSMLFLPPIRPKKPRTPSDVDLIAVHPANPLSISLLDGRSVSPKPHLAIEVKGWIDYPRTYSFNFLLNDLPMVDPKLHTIPDEDWGNSYFSLLSNAANQTLVKYFGLNPFDRVILLPKPEQPLHKLVNLKQLVHDYLNHGIFLISFDDIVPVIFNYAADDKNKAEARRSLVLEMLRFLSKVGYEKKAN